MRRGPSMVTATTSGRSAVTTHGPCGEHEFTTEVGAGLVIMRAAGAGLHIGFETREVAGPIIAAPGENAGGRFPFKVAEAQGRTIGVWGQLKDHLGVAPFRMIAEATPLHLLVRLQ